MVTLSAAQIKASVATTGGAGGSGATNGAPGAAKSILTINATGYASATVTAQGGGGAGGPGAAVAKAKATGTSGKFSASANSGGVGVADGLLVTQVSATASGAVSGKNKAVVKAAINATPAVFVAAGQAMANITGLPGAASTGAVLNANPAIATTFGANPVFFAMGELGGGHSNSSVGAQSITDTVSLDVDLTKLASKEDLAIGFFDTTALGTGFSSLSFTLKNGANVLITKTFSSAALAEAFFKNGMDLGALGTGALAGSSLALTATFTLATSAAGQGFYTQFLIGDPPPRAAKASASQFVQSMSVFGAMTAGPLSVEPNAPPFTPLMSLARSLR